MRIAVIGRTRVLLDAAERLVATGHCVPLVWTAKGEAHYTADEENFLRFAHQCDARFINSSNINTETALAALRDARCDIAVSVNFPGIIRDEALRSFSLGILNAHAGDLPRYRGNACPNWAIINNEERVGLCVHLMAPELDAGPVLLREYFPLTGDAYIEEIYDWMRQRIPEMMFMSVNGLADGSLAPVPQPADPSLVLRTFPRRPEDGRIRWNDDALAVYRLVRASSRPFSGAFTFLEGQQKLVIWRAAPFTYPYPYAAVPGQICLLENGDPVIACGRGMLRLLELEGDYDETALKNLRNRLI